MPTPAAELPAELLRVYSPSAEVRGHGADERRLQTGKKQVRITAIEPVGNYGIRLQFDDGHDTGIYAWDTPARPSRQPRPLLALLLGRTEGRQRLPPADHPGAAVHAQA